MLHSQQTFRQLLSARFSPSLSIRDGGMPSIIVATGSPFFRPPPCLFSGPRRQRPAWRLVQLADHLSRTWFSKDPEYGEALQDFYSEPTPIDEQAYRSSFAVRRRVGCFTHPYSPVVYLHTPRQRCCLVCFPSRRLPPPTLYYHGRTACVSPHTEQEKKLRRIGCS